MNYYTSFSLNGAWKMNYTEERYISDKNPWTTGTLVENAVPGYWEDMTEAFCEAPFLRRLKINPEYGIQKYPIFDTAPDMALPNILGTFFYRRTFRWKNTHGSPVIHFEGVQNTVSVWINDVFLERREGYSTPFDIKITDGLLKDGENTIVLSVSNHRLKGYDDEPVSGLTSRAANECTGGITGDIELRIFPGPLRDIALFVSDDCRTVTVKPDILENAELCWEVYDNGKQLKAGKCNGDFTFEATDLELWCPESPKLYTLKITCGNTVLKRKFGVRRLLAVGESFTLNGAPYYLRGICEHCYFPETVHPGHDINYYRSIIRSVKKLGFNFIRFHTYIPEEEYMQAADELGILIHVESPNNTTLSEWNQIVRFCRRHTSVVIYCCGNEMLLDEPFIEHIRKCAEDVHENTDSLFSPYSALRGLEYWFFEPKQEHELADKPFRHHPRRFKTLGEFSDMYSSFTNEMNSYESLNCDPAEVDAWGCVYNKPRVCHEICIDGTYTDLSLKNRYNGLRIGKTDMFSSIERHLESKGLLSRAPLYFRNSSEWQRRIRKYCFEQTRRSNRLAGFDFLGPIDTHWHTFGYDVGMMNEFYELKPGETVRNVLMYNSPTVLLTDLERKTNFYSGENLNFSIYASHFGSDNLINAKLNIRLTVSGKIIHKETIDVDKAENGKVTKLYDFAYTLPEVKKPQAMKLYITLDGNELFTENEWELYIFPKVSAPQPESLIVSEGMSGTELEILLKEGKDVLILGSDPFVHLPTSFRIALAGRTSGNLATVIGEHPVLSDIPHDGFCGWQFGDLLEEGKAICFEDLSIPFNPIIEVVSSHKYAIRQSALFEFKAFNGRFIVCSLDFNDNDPAANWLKARLISYASSEEFLPADTLNNHQFHVFVNAKKVKMNTNPNVAFNPNDKTALRRKNK